MSETPVDMDFEVCGTDGGALPVEYPEVVSSTVGLVDEDLLQGTIDEGEVVGPESPLESKFPRQN